MKNFGYRKKYVLLFLFLACIMMSLWKSVFAMDSDSLLSVSADSAILMCADNGYVLFAKNEKKERPMASTTKIMTALLTLEDAERENREIRIDNTMVPVEGSSMYLKEGDVLTLESLAKGMMSVSGNDAANSAAIAVGGSVENFVQMMNEKAKQIGMNNTHFVTPSGLDSGDHHSTAYDMALLGAYAMENKMFYDIVSKKSVKIPFIEPEGTRILKNENRLLSEYDGCIGIKTGYTSLAKRCLVSCAERNGVRLVCVTLNAPNDWNDHKSMFDYGFSKVESVELGFDDIYTVDVVGGEKCCMTVAPKNLSKVTLEKGSLPMLKKHVELNKFEYAPIRDGELVGQVIYTLNGKKVSEVDLYSKESIDIHFQKKNFFQRIFDFLCR